MFAKILNAAYQSYPLSKPNAVWLRLRFIKHTFKHYQLVASFVENIEKLGYANLFLHKIPVLGAVEWPYIHKDWTVAERFAVMQRHYEVIKKFPSFLDVADGNPKVILDLSAYSPDTKIVLDKAQWFVREGEIVLNLFKEDLRIMSIAFTLSEKDHHLVMFIGAIQGLHANEHSLEKFKVLTKDFEGLRPRDLLMEVLRMLAKSIGVSKVLAIADAYRHHRHPYFADYHANTLKSSYDEIWLEQCGVAFGGDFYEIPIQKPRKDIAEVSSNKRAMYRRRYEMLDALQLRVDLLFGKKRVTAESVDAVEALPQKNHVEATRKLEEQRLECI